MGAAPWWFGLEPQLNKPPHSKVRLKWHVILPQFRDVHVIFPHFRDVNALVNCFFEVIALGAFIISFFDPILD
jgi:hypothetical protein